MKKIIILITAVIFLSGCATQDRCSRKFPASIITKDSIVTRTIFIKKDSTIFVKIPSAVGNISGLVNCDSANKAQLQPVLLENNRLRIALKIVNGQLYATSECKEDSLQAIISRYQQIIDTTTNQVVYKEKPQYIYKMYWWQSWLLYLGIMAIIYLAVKAIINKLKNLI